MANLYARSTDGNNADSGATWALAKANVGSLGLAAGDTGYVSQSHSETTAASVTIALAGTLASPSKIVCGNDAAEPPTATAQSAVVAATGASTITVTGLGYIQGLIFKYGSGNATSTPQMLLARALGEVQIFENCEFWNESTGGGSNQLGSDSSGTYGVVKWNNCNVKFGAASQGIVLNAIDFAWRGGSILAGTAINRLFTAETFRAMRCLVEGVDLSNGATGMDLITTTTARASLYVFRNCKMPASWSGNIFSSGTVPNIGSRAEMYNCDSADTNYRLWIEDYCGRIKSETTIIRTGGASDGTTGLSWKMVTSANAEYPTHHLVSSDIAVWNDTTGASKTLTVEIVHDSQGAGSGSKFQDDEIWLELQYYGTSGFPLGAMVSDCKASVVATAANQADSTETWTTTGLTTPVKQALSVTFTPQEKGYFLARVVLAKASKTVYVCPKVTVS